MSLVGEIFRDVVEWRELLTPKFWEYRRATRILRHAKFEAYQHSIEASRILTEAHWRVEDDYYGLGYTIGFEKPQRWPFFWEII